MSPGLADRLARAAEPAEGLFLVLERALSAGGLDRGLVAFRDRDVFRVISAGHDNGFTREVTEAAGQPDTPLGDAIRSGERTLLPAPGNRSGDLAVLPLGEEDPWGAILVDAGAETDQIAELEAVFLEHMEALDQIRVTRELKDRNRRLGEERELLTTIVNSLPDPVVLTDGSNDIILANDQADHLFAAASEDSEGRRRAVQLNNLLFSSFLTQSVISSAAQSKPRELNLVDPTDGSDLLFEVLSNPVVHAYSDGAHLSILRNITDLKRALAELEAQFQRSRVADERVREEWRRLNATVENVGDPILVTDDHSNIILMNRDAERLFEVTQDAPPSSSHLQSVRENDAKFTSLMSDFLVRPEPRRVEKVQLRQPEEGSTFPVEVVSSKIQNDRGEATAIVSVIHDLTQMVENERLARELQKLNEELEDRIRLATVELAERNRRLEWQSRELEKASRLKSEFLASMSHELRTPINAVLGYTSLMREEIYGDLTEKQKAGLDKVNTASQHLLDLINDILDLSKIEAGKMPVYLEEVSVKQLVSTLLEAVEPLARDKAIDLTIVADEELPQLFTDRTKLKQILLNLLSNAIKFTSEGGVTLRVNTDSGDRVAIAVEDTGIGIRSEDLDTIFDDFRQVDQSPTREYGGTGLGLSITRKLVALLDGEIEVQSTYGEGSTFRVALPKRLEPGTREEQLQRALASSRDLEHAEEDHDPPPGPEND
jgi:PAS domain S-box-containing protein